MAQTLTLTRRGVLDFENAKDRSLACGHDKIERIYYRCELTVPPEALDDNGFIVDQLAVNDRVVGHYREVTTVPSCERIALEMIEMCRELCPDAVMVVVTVGATKFAFMTARWEADSPKKAKGRKVS